MQSAFYTARSRYLRCLLEAKMSGIIHGLRGLLRVDLFGNQRDMKVNESAENTVLVSNQFRCVGFSIFYQFRIFDVGLEGCNIMYL